MYSLGHSHITSVKAKINITVIRITYPEIESTFQSFIVWIIKFGELSTYGILLSLLSS